MCATNLWAVNAAAFTPEFQRFTEERIGVAPQLTSLRIASGRVRKSSVIFTLTGSMCDCSALIGRRNEQASDQEASADDWLGWFRDLPSRVPHVARVAVLHAWNPQDDAVTPRRARGVTIDELSEQTLRDLRDDHLLTVDYPRVL